MAGLWNRRSLDMLTKFITSSVPLGRTRGQHVSQDVAQSYTQPSTFCDVVRRSTM